MASDLLELTLIVAASTLHPEQASGPGLKTPTEQVICKKQRRDPEVPKADSLLFDCTLRSVHEDHKQNQTTVI